jgi:hypothetical protein
VTRRVYTARIRVAELDAVRDHVRQTNEFVSVLLAQNGPYWPRIESDIRTQLQRIQGHLARVQDELRTLSERTDAPGNGSRERVP